MVLPMATATLQRVDESAVEAQRRTLMAESDSLLDDVERLRLDDRDEVPQSLRDAIRALQVRLGRTDPPAGPATLHGAHDLVFAVQQRVMAANPKHPRPNRHAGRPGGQPSSTPCAPRRNDTSRISLSPSLAPRGRTTGSSTLKRRRSKAV